MPYSTMGLKQQLSLLQLQKLRTLLLKEMERVSEFVYFKTILSYTRRTVHFL